MNNIVFALTVSFILIINITIAFIRKKGGKITFLQYVANPNIYKRQIIALTLTGTIVGGGMFLAVGQMGYENKYIGLILGGIYILGLGFMGFYAKKIRHSMDSLGCCTLLDYMSLNYKRKVTRLFTAVNFFMYLFLLASQFVAMFNLLSFFESRMTSHFIPYLLVVLGIIALFLYPIIGGIKKDIQTDVIQMVVIFISALIIIYKLITNDVISKVFISNNFQFTSENSYGLVFIIGSLLFLTPSFFVRMDMWQRINTAKTTKDAKYGFWLAGFFSFLFFSLFTLIGSYANVLKFQESQFASLNTIFYILDSPLLLGFVIGAFFAAVLSSADTLINNVSIFSTKLIYPNANFSADTPDNVKLLTCSRISAILLIIISILIALVIPDIVDLLIGAFSLLLIFFPTIIGLLGGHKNSEASFYSALSGLLLFLVLFLLWNPKLAFVPSVIISFVVYFTILYIYKLSKNNTKNT